MTLPTTRVPTFSTPRLVLTEVRPGDIASYQRYFANYSIIKNLSRAVPWPFPPDGARSFLENEVFPRQGRDRWMWGLHLRTTPNQLIGAVDLWKNGCPEHRGFWLGEPFWGQGYMTEAVQPIITYAFAELGFPKLVFAHATQNARSRRIKEKTGAVWVRNEPAEFVRPDWTEREIWELSATAWLSRRGPEATR